MKLIHSKTLKNVKIADLVTSSRGEVGVVHHFVPPHKPSSSGHVSVRLKDGQDSYNYVGVWGLEWIEREDRVGSRVARGHVVCSNCGRSG